MEANTQLLHQTLNNLGLEEKLIAEVMQYGRWKQVKAEAAVIDGGTKAEEMPMVVTGSLRVMREDEQGNEMFLYYLDGGDACAMSISCCLAIPKHKFKALAETDTWLWMVPMAQLDDWMSRYPSFRRFVISSYQDRFEEMLSTIDSIAFMKLDERLMKYLLDKKQSSGAYIIEKTHEQIARDLGSSRVVISRLLKKLEQEGKIELYRNRVEVL